MDSKTFRLSIVAILTTIVLIVVVVYASNRDRINSMFGGSVTETVDEEAGAEPVSGTNLGEQIGDNLKGFLTADDFFDKSEQRPSVVVVVDNVPVPANADPVEEQGDTGFEPVPGTAPDSGDNPGDDMLPVSGNDPVADEAPVSGDDSGMNKAPVSGNDMGGEKAPVSGNVPERVEVPVSGDGAVSGN